MAGIAGDASGGLAGHDHDRYGERDGVDRHRGGRDRRRPILAGGTGTAFGAVIGAVLIELIRNSLTLLGINPFWQGTFVGSFIVIAVLFDRFATIARRSLFLAVAVPVDISAAISRKA